MSISKKESSIFNLAHYKESINDRYEKHIETLKKKSKQTDAIEHAVNDAVDNINKKNTRSFVIYGEPQSGKTEMMIALTAKLLDEGHKVIIQLLNDSVDLLTQNLRRFKLSGLSPSPKVFKEILDPEVKIHNTELILFCKKNSSDLQKLIDKVGHLPEKVIIDDEADYASPNSKVNKGEKTKINELIENLLGKKGIYIGVTATPARLDLNNTFENDHEKWVDFPTHLKYTGQDIFFPIASNDPGFGFNLFFLKDADDSPKYIKEALFRYLIKVSYLNTTVNEYEQNYSMLIHTSGKKIDHRTDKSIIESLLSELNDEESTKYEKHIQNIWEIAAEIFPGKEDEITQYVVKTKKRLDIIVLNSDRYNANLEEAANPVSPFTIVIGGNIVSRGVTFNNLLSMFFTRDVRHKIQQDTYIQRARMFGARGDYLKYFELTIPETLYTDWHRCFVFHRLAITAIRDGKGAPVWLSDNRITPAASNSIDRGTVSFDRGEMSFSLFDFDKKSEFNYEGIINSRIGNFQKIEEIKKLFGDSVLPEYLEKYIKASSFLGEDSIAIHGASSIDGYDDADKHKIERQKGFFGATQMQKNKYPDASHHLKVFFSVTGKARLFYKFNGSIQFIKNLKSTIERSVK